ncbi:hypothetical protein [Arthrobacter sp. 9MFCol3.1]|uniref:hypothetical protein n=1 Tax=Arthrobacter sp. 9MFCol3.1 TaxID=1150398 RepID=UPI00047ECF65|nr:hypothetical protein [Arthrobacter sp. 9MFCol3.1]
MIRLLLFAVSGYARHGHLRRHGADDPDLQDAHHKFWYDVVAYVITILISLIDQMVAIALLFAIAVFLFLQVSAHATHTLGGPSPLSGGPRPDVASLPCGGNDVFPPRGCDPPGT